MKYIEEYRNPVFAKALAKQIAESASHLPEIKLMEVCGSHTMAIARYGIRVQQVQDVIEVAIGGKRLTTTVEGRERFPVRVRYLRELRDSIEALERILVPLKKPLVQ